MSIRLCMYASNDRVTFSVFFAMIKAQNVRECVNNRVLYLLGIENTHRKSDWTDKDSHVCEVCMNACRWLYMGVCVCAYFVFYVFVSLGERLRSLVINMKCIHIHYQPTYGYARCHLYFADSVFFFFFFDTCISNTILCAGRVCVCL